MIFSHASLVEHVAFWCAVVPAALFCWNLFYFRKPPVIDDRLELPKLSVLIPARNEEGNIGRAVASVLASRGVELELIVLDDASTDRTAAIVQEFASADPRVRCISAPALTPGWAGKAHAAHALSQLAGNDVFCFIDADVYLSPDALARMLVFLQRSRSELVSGFPEEITVTPLEWLLLPLIHFLLLSYLPFAGLRHSSLPGFGVGCGQFLMMSRAGYEKTGGYASIKTTMHDGVMMAKLFRKHRLHTEVADLTGLAFCRMYRSNGDVWSGLMKNATEGIAAPARILPFTFLLFCGQILPWLLLPFALINRKGVEIVLIACIFSLIPRLLSIVRFRQKAIGAILHPLGITIFLVLQWSALVRKLRGTPAIWKGRAFEVG